MGKFAGVWKRCGDRLELCACGPLRFAPRGTQGPRGARYERAFPCNCPRRPFAAGPLRAVALVAGCG